jgi:hypothetical protein
MKKYIPFLILLVLTLACGLPFELNAPTPTPKPAPLITLPTPTTAPSPVVPTPTETPLVVPSNTPEGPYVNRVNIAWISLEDKGRLGKKIGCDDSVVLTNINIPATKTPLQAAYEYLFSYDKETYEETGLFNVFYESDLKVEKVTIENNTAEVRLSGKLVLRGLCDAPRVTAQLEEIAYQYPWINAVNIYINDLPLKDVLSQQK